MFQGSNISCGLAITSLGQLFLLFSGKERASMSAPWGGEVRSKKRKFCCINIDWTAMAVVCSSHARILGECSTVHSPPALFFSSFFFFFLVEISSRTLNCTLSTRISLQWFGELRRLWLSVPWRVACEPVSLYISTLCLHSCLVSPLQLRIEQPHEVKNGNTCIHKFSKFTGQLLFSSEVPFKSKTLYPELTQQTCVFRSAKCE